MFATVISLTLSFFGANPILDAEPAVSEFRNVREIAEETPRAAILEEQQRPLKELAVAKLYNMLPAEELGTADGRTAATNATVRSVFVIG